MKEFLEDEEISPSTMERLRNIPLGTRIMIVACVIFAIIAGITWHRYHTAPIVKPANQVATHNIPPVNTPATQPNLGPSQEQLELGFVAKGSGGSIWKALASQLRADPKAQGYEGDVNDTAALTKWVNQETMASLIESGKYYHGIGDEIRTYGDVSYVFVKDANGKRQIAEYVVTKGPVAGPTVTIGDKTLSLAVTNTLATSVATSHFSGASPTTGEKLPVSHWEYVYFPHG